MKAEFLMLAETYIPFKHRIAGWFMSEKIDGIRAFWDGGLSAGIPIWEIPWANRTKDTKDYMATGLWSRTGKAIFAPKWWLSILPSIPLDGELCGLGFQELASAVGREDFGGNWGRIDYKVFDSPPLSMVFEPRTVKVRNDYEWQIFSNSYWFDKANDLKIKQVDRNWQFAEVYLWLQRMIPNFCHKQEQLPFTHNEAIKRLNEFCDEISARGGEGVMLRKPSSFWVSHRSRSLLKYKPFKTAEGRVIGYSPGEGRLEGMLGALVLLLENGKELKLSGFTDEQRTYFKIYYPVGTLIEFKYRELSDDGVPKEARFMRVRYDFST